MKSEIFYAKPGNYKLPPFLSWNMRFPSVLVLCLMYFSGMAQFGGPGFPFPPFFPPPCTVIAASTTTCGPGPVNVTLTANPANPGEFVRWFTSPTGGEPLNPFGNYTQYIFTNGGNSITLVGITNSTTMYAAAFGSQCPNGGSRVPVTATVSTPPAPVVPPQVLCSPTYLNSIQVPGYNLVWYGENNKSLQSREVEYTYWPIGTDRIFYVGQVLNGCIGELAPVRVTINSRPSAPEAGSQVLCGASTVADLVPNGQNIKWYDKFFEFDSEWTIGTPISSNYSLPPGFKNTLYVTQTVNGCESQLRSVSVFVQESTSTWYMDEDNDGYSSGVTVQACTQPVGAKLAGDLKAISGDCNDNDDTINPGAAEICDNGKDDNCNGQTDEGCVNTSNTWYRDKDGDGFGMSNWVRVSATRPVGFVANPGDCNDADNTIYPGAPELPDGKDNNCNGQIDDGLTCQKTWYRDVDGDGVGRSNWTKLSCVQPDGFVDITGDCNDLDPTIYPGAPELSDNKDNDCNGLADDGLPCLKTWYRDVDGDGVGRDNWTRQGCLKPEGFVEKGGDCRDWDATIYPGATDVCDGKDNDCDGLVDEDCGIFVTKEDMAPVTPKLATAADVSNKLAVSIWPNPAVSEINIVLDAAEPGKKVTLTLMGSDGRSLQSQTVTPVQRGERVQMKVGGLAPGYYLLRAQQGGKSEVKKVLVTR